MHWLTLCHTNPAGFNLQWPDVALTTKPWVHIDLAEKKRVNVLQPLNQSFFATLAYFFRAASSFLDCLSWITKPDKIYQTTNLLLVHVIALDIDWCWKNFSSPHICSMLIEQLIDFRKVRSENLKFTMDLWDSVIDGRDQWHSRWLFWVVNSIWSKLQIKNQG